MAYVIRTDGPCLRILWICTVLSSLAQQVQSPFLYGRACRLLYRTSGTFLKLWVHLNFRCFQLRIPGRTFRQGDSFKGSRFYFLQILF